VKTLATSMMLPMVLELRALAISLLSVMGSGVLAALTYPVTLLLEPGLAKLLLISGTGISKLG